MAHLRFCAYQYQHLPLKELRDRWRVVEDLGFDVLWNCNTVVEPDRKQHTMFDGPATLTMMAAATNRIRVGTLVTSLYFRHPVTLPRPPLTIAAHGPKMLRIAAEYGDAWSSWGGYDVETEEDFYAVTAERRHRFDDLCVDAGRDPSTIRHSLVCFPPLTPWQSVEYFRDMVGRFAEIGIDEFVLYWPNTWRDAPSEQEVFEEVGGTVMAQMRASGTA